MATAPQMLALRSYAKRVREARRTHPDITEPALAPQAQRLIEELLPTLPAAPHLMVSPEFQKPGVGRPDIALKRPGEPPRAFIELKAPDKSTDGAAWRNAHDSRQFARFGELAHWAVFNFHELRLYHRRDALGHAVLVPAESLEPNRSDSAADKIVSAHDPDAALRLIERLAQASQPSASDAKQLAQLLAYSARLVRGIVGDRLAETRSAEQQNTALQQVRQEFRDVLYAHPEAAGYSSGDFDALFSAAFAQTLAFGLLLVREATGAHVDEHASDHMPAEHPLMRTALQVLSMDQVAREVGAGFEVMLDTVNGFDPVILAAKPGGHDPILYFYEDFLETFDPQARERFGVYYTPVQVVRYMVGALDRSLKERLNTTGISDEQVHILDPAAGTGTFLLAIADRLRLDAAAEHGAGQDALALRGLAKRMYGFELLVGPYAVAHFRLHHALWPAGAAPGGGPGRLGVYLTDTLARPGAAAPAGVLGFVSDGIRDERVESNRVKSEQPILAIIGNPPYRRLEAGENHTLVGQWMDELWDDLKAPVRDARQGGQLNTFPELSVAFWRWAMWKMFESDNAPRRGVVAFITNRKFLTGWPYAGLRKMMRERFDLIEVVDLRGDVRRGERAGMGADQGVFNIQVGTAITIAVADGSKAGAPADVTYNDSWAQNRLTRTAKLAWLEQGEQAGALTGSVAVNRSLLDDMRPRPFLNGELSALNDMFLYSKSSVQSGNDDVFVNVSRINLSRNVISFLASGKKTSNASLETFYVYRPLDRRWFYNDRDLLNRPRPELQSVWGNENVALYALPGGTALGPAVWCHGLLPDYHAFRGSYGGYAFPLFDRRADRGPYNLRLDLLTALAAAYGGAVTPEAVFDAVLALLSADSYTTRFAEDLEDVFPHVPFPATRPLFEEAAALGAEIRAVETFARKPGAGFSKGLAIAKTAPAGPLAPAGWADGVIVLCADGSGRVEGVPQAVWDFAVSGYRLLPRWLAARAGGPIGPAFIPEMRDVAGRIAELLDLFARADSVLRRTLDSPLVRAALSLDPGAEPDATE